MYALDAKPDHECFFSLGVNFEGGKEYKNPNAHSLGRRGVELGLVQGTR